MQWPSGETGELEALASGFKEYKWHGNEIFCTDPEPQDTMLLQKPGLSYSKCFQLSPF